ncbi:MAG: DUF5702 domain-containing protein [Clostridiales bacterium]|nr:DUF5702 domain-containing protein [Clostridiales bacterium]
MLKFFQNTKGAVTVFVTLLLIPAVLISGTAVDLTRIQTAKSIVTDANQLAANAVLTQYDALLKDLYGLFGVMAEDPELAEMVNEYIEVAVFGEDWNDKNLGTFQLFYGANINTSKPISDSRQNLRNPDVLRRQIEEYMKFRGPVIIVKDFIELISGNTLKKDAEIIDDKLTIDSAIAGLYDKYKELYEAIKSADNCKTTVGFNGRFGNVSGSLRSIRDQFIQAKGYYESWETIEDEEGKNIFSNSYSAVLKHIENLTTGSGSLSGLEKNIENAKKDAGDFKPNYATIVKIAKEIDSMQAELKRKIEELKAKLDSGECDEDLKKALTERGSDGKSQIERYQDILKWEITPMADTYKEKGDAYIDSVIDMLDKVRFRNADNPAADSLSRGQLANLSSNPAFKLSGSVTAKNSKAAYFAGFANVSYNMPDYLKFAECSDNHRKFFEELKQMMEQPALEPVKLFEDQEDAEGKDAKEKQENIIDALVQLINEAYNGLTNSPRGAKFINDEETADPEKIGFLDTVGMIKDALNDDILGVFSDPLGSLKSAGDYVLLLTYDTSMFSNYTTTKPDSIGKEAEKIAYEESITGVKLSPEVNYFYQSEWEYLYSGKKSAGANLNAITKLIFTVRLVCNYITVFKIKEISAIVTSIRAAFSWCPPAGIILGELARAAFVIAETVIDIASLRSGHKVPLIKSASEWVCSIKGISGKLADIAKSGASDEKKEKGLSYANYLLAFFVAKAVLSETIEEASRILAERTADLIEWNIINYKNGLNADEEKMTAAAASEDRFRLSDLATGFSISSTVELRMLFLSMPLAQKGLSGAIPPKTMPVRVIDYRGY